MQNNFSQRTSVSQWRIRSMLCGVEIIDGSLVSNESAHRRSSNLRPPAAALNPQRIALSEMSTTLDNVMIFEEAARNAGQFHRRDTLSGRFTRSVTEEESCRLTADLGRLGTTKYGRTSESEMCCICQEDFKEGEQLAALTCNHKFHVGCLARWLTLRNVCPMCKRTALSSL